MPGEDAATTLVGRDPERAVIRAALDACVCGRLEAVVIHGEAGIGKTALLDQARDYATTRGFTVLSGQANDLDERPLAALVQVAGTTPSTVDDAEIGLDHSFLLAESLIGAIEAHALARPTLVVVDDLQWADATTVRTLNLLARRLADLPLVLLVAARPLPRLRELDELLNQLARSGGAFVELTPLDELEVRALAATVLGRDPSPEVQALVPRAGGNPLFVLELLEAVRDGAIGASSGALPPTLRGTVLSRLRTLQPETKHVLEMASLLGSHFTPADLAVVVGKSVTSLLPEIREALQAAVLGEDGELLVFRHDVIREALYEELAPAIRPTLHLEAAEALGAAGRPAVELVPHLLAGVRAAQSSAVDLLRRVGWDLVRTVPASALELFQRAGEVTRDPAVADECQAGMVWPLLSRGQTANAEALCRQMLSRPHDPDLDRWLVAGLVLSLNRQNRGHVDDSEASELQSLPGLADQDRAWVTAVLATGRMLGGDIERAEAMAEDARTAGERAGDAEVVKYARAVLAWVAAARGDVPTAVEQATASAVAPTAAPRLPLRIGPLYLGVVLLEADRLTEAEAVLEGGRRAGAERGHVGFTSVYHWALCGRAYLAGAWDDAIAEAEAGLAFVEEGGNQQGIVFPHALLGRMFLHRGDVSAAESHVAAGEAELAATGPQLGVDLLWWTRALLLEADGRIEEAATTLAAAWELTGAIRYFLSWRSVVPDLVRLTLAVGDRAQAEAVVAVAEEGARRAGGVPSADAAAVHCRGLYESDADTLLHGVDVSRQSPRPFATAALATDAAAALAGSGDRPRAAALLDDAHRLYEHLGADRDADMATARLRDLGVRRGSRAGRRRPRSGWESLTPSELRVVALVADGLTNGQIAQRLFVSRYTVESHLKHVFAKLGMSSRMEVAREVLRRQG